MVGGEDADGMLHPHQVAITLKNIPKVVGSAAIIHPLLLLVSAPYLLKELQRQGFEFQAVAGKKHFIAAGRHSSAENTGQVRDFLHFSRTQALEMRTGTMISPLWC